VTQKFPTEDTEQISQPASGIQQFCAQDHDRLHGEVDERVLIDERRWGVIRLESVALADTHPLLK